MNVHHGAHIRRRGASSTCVYTARRRKGIQRISACDKETYDTSAQWEGVGDHVSASSARSITVWAV